MSARFASITLLACLLVAVPVAAEDGAAALAKPLAAFSYPSEEGVLVTWLPGPEAADSYNVYGIRNGTPILLPDETPGDFAAFVPSGFTGYQVTAVRLGVESPPTVALQADPLFCLTVDPGIPPTYGLDVNCTTDGWVDVKVDRAAPTLP